MNCDADVSHHHLARESATLTEQETDFARRHCHRHRGRHGPTRHGAGVCVHSRRQVDRHHDGRRRRHGSLKGSSQPGTVGRVDYELGPNEVLSGDGGFDGRDLRSRSRQQPRRHSAIGPVRAFAGDNDNPPADHWTEALGDLAGYSATRRLYEFIVRSRLDRQGIEGRHLCHRHGGLHVHRLVDTATADANPASWLIEMATAVTPSISARVAARPWSATNGACPRPPVISISRKPTCPTPTPRDFMTASLAARRAASDRVRPVVVPVAVVASSAAVNRRPARRGRRARAPSSRSIATRSVPIPTSASAAPTAKSMLTRRSPSWLGFVDGRRRDPSRPPRHRRTAGAERCP